MATGYVKSITINVENRETPEIMFTLIPADGSKADDVFYSFSGSPSEPHAYSGNVPLFVENRSAGVLVL